jgi:hypothetical protein
MLSKNRKKVTRSGKGAFSLYLPKKWVDGWGEEQSKERKVDLLELGDHLIISPVKKNSSKSVVLNNRDVDEIRQFLLCSYIKGYEAVELQSGGFSDEQISAARNFMRLLDEKLILDVSEDRIAYGRNFKVNLEVPTVFQIQRLLFEKLQESIRLTQELIEHFDSNPRRTIHLLKMLHILEEEDVDRLSMQIFRMATRMEVRFDSFADLFYVVLTTDLLEKMGDSVYGVAKSVCDYYGLDEEKLLLPLNAIMEDIPKPIKSPASIQDMKGAYLSGLEDCETHLRRIMEITLGKKGREAYQYMPELCDFSARMLEEMLKGSRASLVTKGGNIDERALRLTKIGHHLLEIATLTESLADEVAMFYYCEELPG